MVSPRYVPAESPYLDRWRRWLKENPPRQRPNWLAADLELLKIRGIRLEDADE